MQKLEIDFDELVEYSFDAIEEESTPHKHDISYNTFVFQHDNGKYYCGSYYTSYNEGAMSHLRHECYEVRPVEVITTEYVDVDLKVKGIS